mmetsp:Transcript_53616/g.121942  ORF Transcript_53616/g.121942 Transcript_53616/m.121942 type:complete len:306 (-) Transcript_53616:163-1080(-)
MMHRSALEWTNSSMHASRRHSRCPRCRVPSRRLHHPNWVISKKVYVAQEMPHPGLNADQSRHENLHRAREPAYLCTFHQECQDVSAGCQLPSHRKAGLKPRHSGNQLHSPRAGDPPDGEVPSPPRQPPDNHPQAQKELPTRLPQDQQPLPQVHLRRLRNLHRVEHGENFAKGLGGRTGFQGPCGNALPPHLVALHHSGGALRPEHLCSRDGLLPSGLLFRTTLFHCRRRLLGSLHGLLALLFQHLRRHLGAAHDWSPATPPGSVAECAPPAPDGAVGPGTAASRRLGLGKALLGAPHRRGHIARR